MHRIIIIFSIFTLIVSCKTNVDCGIDPLIVKSNDSIISKAESDSIGQKWWNDYLEKIEEPKLKTLENESYRLLIYNSLGESSKTYRIFKNWNSYKLVYKEFGKVNSDEISNELLVNKESELSKKEWDEFQELLQHSGFWSLPVTIDRIGLDGKSWVLQGINPNGNKCTNREYHVVARWQPIDTMKVMQLNRKLIELNGK
ncbi:hypothetical protein [Winogradskyella ouciana]|uniref:Lipoprotein n=1 Tax=Winogradskyella ouciana TaxID=2608631 RepID=A0A7K1GEE0_9FLAO|nr:hypothetical protein [Winogradskyella ouciana]MTE27670.1 hypothetical protein [Winogradskyella ouciana]